MRGPLHEQIPALAGQSLRVLVWDRDLVDMWCLDQDGKRQPYRGTGSRWHHHSDQELTFITRGEGLLYVGDHIGRFSAPDCLLLGRNLPHVWKTAGATAGVSLQFRLDAESGLGSLAEAAALDRLWSRARFGLRWQGDTAVRLRALLEGMEGRPALVRLSSFLAILDLMQRGEGRRLSIEALSHDEADPRSEAMARVLDHLMEHSDEDIALADAVRLSGRSQATFCRHFIRLTGKTFAAYLAAVRVQEARRLLAQSGRSVTDIAFAVGFNSLTSFHAVFRRQVGCTPLVYRKRLSDRT